MTWKRWGIVGATWVLLAVGSQALAWDREALRAELQIAGWKLYDAIVAGQTEPVIAMLSVPAFERDPQDEAFLLYSGGRIKLSWDAVACEEPDDVPVDLVARSLRTHRGAAYARLFDTAQYRRLNAKEWMWRLGFGVARRGAQFQSVHEHFRQAGSQLHMWVEVHLPGSHEHTLPRGVVHFEWPGRGATEYDNPGFHFFGGQWQITELFSVYDTATHLLARMAQGAILTARESSFWQRMEEKWFAAVRPAPVEFHTD